MERKVTGQCDRDEGEGAQRRSWGKFDRRYFGHYRLQLTRTLLARTSETFLADSRGGGGRADAYMVAMPPRPSRSALPGAPWGPDVPVKMAGARRHHWAPTDRPPPPPSRLRGGETPALSLLAPPRDPTEMSAFRPTASAVRTIT